MSMIKNFVGRFRRDEDGASMVEYAVALLVVTAIGVTAMSALGDAAEANVNCATAAVTDTTLAGC